MLTENLNGIVLPLRFGRKEWVVGCMFATTYDPKSKLVSHYVNGRSFSREKIDLATPLHFGPSVLGNFPKIHFSRQIEA